jgi:hypothetical protein
MCLKCTSKDGKDEINLCLGCSGQPTTARDFVHEPSHDLVKATRVVHNREKAFLFELAKHVSEQADELFRVRRSNQDAEQLDADMRQDSHPPTRPATLRPEISCSCCESPITSPCWFCICCGKEHSPPLLLSAKADIYHTTKDLTLSSATIVTRKAHHA